MAIHLVRPALRVRDLDPTAKVMLVQLADYADDNDIAWPSIETLARFAGRSKSQVMRALKHLEDRKLITVPNKRERGHRGRTCNRYKLDVHVLNDQVTPTCWRPIAAPERRCLAKPHDAAET